MMFYYYFRSAIRFVILMQFEIEQFSIEFGSSFGISIQLSGEFPWTVAILREETALDGQILNVYVCGGSIIEPG